MPQDDRRAGVRKYPRDSRDESGVAGYGGQLKVGLRFRKSVDYIRQEEVTAEKSWLDLNNPRISIRGIWVDAFGFPRAEPWSPRFNCTRVREDDK
jgi:hypothetical protein